jgi:hypothetical protein
MLDPTFGMAGVVRLPPTDPFRARTAVVLPTGDILLAGASAVGQRMEATVLGYTAAGAPNLGTSGRQFLGWSTGSDAIAYAIPTKDGKVLVAGQTWSPTGGTDSILVRMRQAVR